MGFFVECLWNISNENSHDMWMFVGCMFWKIFYRWEDLDNLFGGETTHICFFQNNAPLILCNGGVWVAADFQACLAGHEDVVQLLLAKGASAKANEWRVESRLVGHLLAVFSLGSPPTVAFFTAIATIDRGDPKNLVIHEVWFFFRSTGVNGWKTFRNQMSFVRGNPMISWYSMD